MDTSKTAYTRNEMLMVPVEELPARSRVPIEIFDDPKDMFYQLARRVVDTVKSNNEKGLKTRIAWPVGPKKNYPLMVEMSIRENVSWKNTIHYQVDEWLDWQGRKLPANHPFNLECWLKREFFDKFPEDLKPKEENMFFHRPLEVDYMDRMIEQNGGIDILLGGFGFTGHIAYNEPVPSRWYEVSDEQFKNGSSHIVYTNEETFIMHSHRSTGGNTRQIPPCGITIGFKQILSAKQIYLVSDGGEWKKTILRIMCFHEPTAKYPCTFVQEHPNTLIMVDKKTADCPSMNFIG